MHVCGIGDWNQWYSTFFYKTFCCEIQLSSAGWPQTCDLVSSCELDPLYPVLLHFWAFVFCWGSRKSQSIRVLLYPGVISPDWCLPRVDSAWGPAYPETLLALGLVSDSSYFCHVLGNGTPRCKWKDRIHWFEPEFCSSLPVWQFGRTLYF